MKFNVKTWIKDNASTILTCLGAGGVVATAALAVKATPKAHKKIVSKKIEKMENDANEHAEYPKLTVLETLRICGTDYIPAVMAGIGTVICIFGANALNKRKQAELVSAYAALEQLFRNYRKKTDVICGDGTNRTISRAIMQEEAEQKNDDAPPWDEKQTFYLDGYIPITTHTLPRFFERTMEEVFQAEYEVNRYFRLNGDITLNKFLDIFGLEPFPDGDLIGWDAFIGETQYGYQWIDFEHRHYITDDGLMVCSIDMPFGPHSLDENAEE